MKSKIWTQSFLAFAVLTLLLVFTTNAMMDSRWFSQTDIGLNHKRAVFDERRQKTNYLVHHHPHFNNLILGSSRTSYIATTQIPGRWFNYSSSGMYPEEYIGFAQIASEYAFEKRLDTVLIGLDFWTTDKTAIVDYGDPLAFEQEAKHKWKLATNYLTWDGMKEAFKIVRLNLTDEHHPLALPNEAYYVWPHLDKMRTSMSEDDRDKKIDEQLWYYEHDVYGTDYRFDSSCLAPVKELISTYPNTHFILFNTPVNPKIEAIKVKYDRLGSERFWMNEIKKLDAEWFETDKGTYVDSMFFDTHHLKPWHYNQLVNTMLHSE